MRPLSPLRSIAPWILAVGLAACAKLTAPPEADLGDEPATTTAKAQPQHADPDRDRDRPRPAAAQNEERAGASHILVAYKGAMRAAPSITRTKDEARKRAEEALKKARSGEDFAELAKKYSDDPGSGPRGGALGMFTRGAMVKPFADATFSLKPGELSGIVETDFGFHIIKRTQ
jgi:parvulin-like peptidyl-prolyl isomerase